MGVRIITPFIFWAPKFSLFFVLSTSSSSVYRWWIKIGCVQFPLPSTSGDGVAAKGLSFKNEIAHLAPLLGGPADTLLTPPLARKASRIPFRGRGAFDALLKQRNGLPGLGVNLEWRQIQKIVKE